MPPSIYMAGVGMGVYVNHENNFDGTGVPVIKP